MPCRIFGCHFWVGACPLKPQKWGSGQHRLWNCQSKNYLPCNQRLQKMKIRPLEDGWRFADFFFLTFRILVLYWSLIAFIASTQVQKGRLGQVGLQSGNATMLETIGWYGIFYIQGFFLEIEYIIYWLLGTFEPLELLIVGNDIFRKNHPPRGSWRVQPYLAGSMNHTSPSQISFPKVPFCKKWLSSFLSNKFSNGFSTSSPFSRRRFLPAAPRCSCMVQVLKFRNRQLRLPRLPCWASLIPLKSKLLRYASKQWNVEGSSGSSWRWGKKQRRWLMWWMWRSWWGWDWGENGRLKDWSDVEGAFFFEEGYCIFCEESAVW